MGRHGLRRKTIRVNSVIPPRSVAAWLTAAIIPAANAQRPAITMAITALFPESVPVRTAKPTSNVPSSMRLARWR
jgi:hypothetical protein